MAMGAAEPISTSNRSSMDLHEEHLKWEFFHIDLPHSKALVEQTVFHSNSEFWDMIYQKNKYSKVDKTSWDSKSNRTITYVMPRKGCIPQTSVIERQKLIAQDDKKAVMLVSTATPGAPFGNSFETLAKWTLEHTSEGSCKLILSGGVEWAKNCALRSTITKKIHKAMEKSLSQIVQELQTTLSASG